jgi:hypothetical protein
MAPARMCVCVCVCGEREREREREQTLCPRSHVSLVRASRAHAARAHAARAHASRAHASRASVCLHGMHRCFGLREPTWAIKRHNLYLSGRRLPFTAWVFTHTYTYCPKVYVVKVLGTHTSFAHSHALV